MATRTIDAPPTAPRDDRTPAPTPARHDDRKPARHRGRVATFVRRSPAFHVVVIAVLLVSTIAAVVWRATSVARLETELAAARQHARTAMTAQASELLQLSAIPLAWAVRAEILANDLGDIDAYMQKLITERHVERIVLVGRDGTIIASTDIKLKGQPAATALAGIELATTEPHVVQTPDELRAIVPVMDFERQIGTLVLDYSLGSDTTSLLRH